MLAVRPDHAEAYLDRGLILQALTRPGEALASYDQALAINADYAEAYNNRGTVLADLRRHEEALASFDRALTIRPSYPDALHNRAMVLHGLARRAEALVHYDAALAMRPDDANTLHLRSDVLRELNRFDEALASCERALAIRPDMAAAHNNRGLILEQLRRLPEAFESFAKAQQLAPDYAEAHWNEAALRLLTGDFLRGWAKYEWRWKCDKLAPWRRQFSQPQWDGLGSVYNKTILLHGTRQLGEAILFCRYVPQVTARGARVILDVPEPMRPVMKSLVGGPHILSENDEPPRFDLHCPLTSLPAAFGTKLDTIPSATPYLRPPTDALLAWEMRLGAKKRPRIGLAWATCPLSAAPTLASPASEELGAHGRGKDGDDRSGSIALEGLLPLFASEATFVRLQKDLRPGDDALLKGRGDIFDPTEALGDYSDFAALISRLDLIISVDSDPAHLAGALGKPVWILLPFTPDWPWQLGRNITPWYPTARLYRQAKPGDWLEVVARIVADLPSVVARDAPSQPLRHLM
jgi:Tfp pilus assembly protein PilF